jgi:uncharacterized protein (TIRG00374 family)
MANRGLRVAVSLALMAVLLAVFLWNVDLSEVGGALERTDFLMVALAVAVALVSYWFRAVRWQLILRPVATFRHSSAVLATAVGYAAMTLLPARMGDLVRPIVLSRRERLPVSATLASILTERIFDLWTVVLYFLVFVIWPPPMAELGEEAARNLETLRISGYVVGAGLLAGTLVLLGLFRFQERFVSTITRPVGWFRDGWRQPAVNFLNHFLDGLRVLQRPRDLMVTMGSSLLLWYLIYWQVRITLLAFDLDFPLRVAYFIVTMAVIGLAVPSPGGVGGFHFATQVGLTTFFAVDLNLATAVAIVYHAICFVPITIIGLLCLPLMGMRLSEARDLDEKDGEP